MGSRLMLKLTSKKNLLIRSEKKKDDSSPVRHRKLLHDSIDGVTRPAIRRMARRGGVKRLASISYEAIRTVLRQFLHHLLHDVVAYAEHGKRKTVLPQDVIHALARIGRTIYGYV